MLIGVERREEMSGEQASLNSPSEDSDTLSSFISTLLIQLREILDSSWFPVLARRLSQIKALRAPLA